MDEIENIESHMAKACECGSVHFNLLKSGEIECADCQDRFGQWTDLSAGIYYCEGCRILRNQGIRRVCECGTSSWKLSKT